MKKSIFTSILFAALALFICAAAHATIQWTNNATSIIADSGGISAGAVSLNVYAGHGDRFPAVASPHYFMVTLVDTSGNREIVKVTERIAASNTMTIVRAQEGTAARAFAQSSLVELRITKNALDYLSKSADIHEGWYVADYSAADQGATTNSSSIKSLVTTIGASKEAYIFLPNADTAGTETTYTVSTDITITDNIVLVIPKGSYITPDSGKTVTLAAPPQAGPYQIFDGDGTVTVTGYPQEQAWWGETQRLDLTGATVGGTNVSLGLAPAGAMMPYAGSTAPTGWLLCYGQAVSRVTYATLFGVVGTTFGVGNGSTTFNVPDMRGRGFIGMDNLGGVAASRVAAATSVGDTGGAETANLAHTHTTGDVTLTAAQSGLPAHTHGITVYNEPGNYEVAAAGNPSTGVIGTAGVTANSAANASEAHNHGATGSAGSATQAILNPYMAGGWIIKY